MTPLQVGRDEEDYRTLLDTVPHIVWTTDPDGRLDYVNERGKRYLGVAMDEVSGEGWIGIVHPDDVDRTLEAWQASLESGSEYRLRLRFESPAGYLWFQAHAVPVVDEDGSIVRWVGTLTDIDAAKRAEQDLRESEERFRQIANHIHEVLWLVDRSEDRLVYVSPAYETIWGRSRRSLYEDPASWLEAVHPEDRERIREAARTRQATGEYDETYRIVRSDGEVRWIHARAFPIEDEEEVVRIAGVAEDVTERRRLEHGLREAQKIEAIALLSGGIAHDFNNVLTAIRGNAEMALADLPEGSPVREELEGIVSSARSATALTRQLLTFSRRKVLAPRPVSLPEFLEDMESMLRRLIPASVEFEIEAGEGDAVTTIDPGQLEQVVMNLVVNARDATPPGGSIAVRVLRGESRVGLEVEDTGTGMDAATRERVFEPLFTTKPSGEGTGLGLFTVRGIVEDAGGTIEFESAPGEGATFQVWLSASPERREEAVADDRPPDGKARGRGETILVVEDESSVARFVEKVLAQKGYEVHVASDGAVALNRIRSGEVVPHLVMTDVVMPRVGGPELAEQLRAAGIEVPILFTSGYPGSGGMGRRGVPEGARFLEKPYSPTDLTREVRAALDARL